MGFRQFTLRLALAIKRRHDLLNMGTHKSQGGDQTPAIREPKRISVTIPYAVYMSLLTRSEHEGRSLSNLASYLLESHLKEVQSTSSAESVPMQLRGRS